MKIRLHSHFQSWASISFFNEKGEVIKRVASAPNTWHDDGDSTKVVDVEVSRYVVVYHHSQHGPSVHEVFGFTPEELEKPVEGGYYLEWGQHTQNPVYVGTMLDLITSRAIATKITLWSSLSDGVHTLPYHWGDQAAEWYVLIKDGKLLDTASGCGDRTPYISESTEKCLVDGRLYTSDNMTDQAIEHGEYEDAFWAMAERLGVANEYRNIDWCDEGQRERGKKLSRKIELVMSRADADARASDDRTGVLRRLLKHYRSGQNPLRSLRKEKGGDWAFHRESPDADKLPEGAVIYHGDGWWVTWIK